ncbi:MAG: hypothetical protein WC378_03245 [Opitutaceae bacterium]|jgi:predicted LPLAT superfamily acyltransferase
METPILVNSADPLRSCAELPINKTGQTILGRDKAKAETKNRRNPGPSWGYRFLRVTDKVAPEWLYKPLRAIGTAIAMAGMPAQRAHSRAYLEIMLGRRVGLLDIFRHFFAFEEALMLKLRIANGRDIPCRYAPGSDDCREWMEHGGAVLLGSMHVGVSDMLGVQIGSMHQRQVFLVRQRVENSHDTEEIESRFGRFVKFIWVNDPGDVLFALKDAASTEYAIAMQCDRLEHSSRSEVFMFLGKNRRFPFTIYHLAILFCRPVLLSVGTSSAAGHSIVHSSPRFELIEGEDRAQALARAREHFQAFLRLVEEVLRQNPYVWFNFVPLNSVEEDVCNERRKR